MTDIIDNCKGCRSNNYVLDDITFISDRCRYNRSNDEGKCPCTECIVKVMCNDPCREFEDFTFSSRNLLKIQRNT